MLCLFLGFPLALYIARSARHKTLLLNLVMLPFWTSFLIRTYAWMFLLRDTGLVNTLLEGLHIVRAPLPLLFNDGAVVLGLVYGFLPFMVLPLYATLEKLDPALLDAAFDLGATPWVALWRVIVPLSKPGIAAGCVLVFIPCLGAYLTPDLMGGGKTVMLGNLVQSQFTTRARLAFWRRYFTIAHADGAVGRAGAWQTKREAPMRRFLAVYAAAAYLFLYLPLAVLGAFSFNSSKIAAWRGFTLRLVPRACSTIAALFEGTMNSLIIAVAATAVSTVIGTLAGYALWKKRAWSPLADQCALHVAARA